jgi:hypothetical protein
MQMFVVARQNPDALWVIDPLEGGHMRAVEEMGDTDPATDDFAPGEDLFAFVCEGPALAQLFPRADWAQAVADSEGGFVLTVEVNLG